MLADPKTTILEASIRKSSRDVIGFSLSLEEIELGRIPVSWEVLEQGDGGLIEVIYAGSPEIDFKAEGAIVGRKKSSGLKIESALNPRPRSMKPYVQEISEPADVVNFLFEFVMAGIRVGT